MKFRFLFLSILFFLLNAKLLSQNSAVSTLYIPNAFTPNGDELNDTFCAYSENIIEFEGIIFNRRLAIIYEWENPEDCWDGNNCQDGIVFYKIKAKGRDGVEYEQFGSILIIM